jgi:hypothetical protein
MFHPCVEFVGFGCLVVSVLGIGPTVRGFKPVQGRIILMAIKVRSTTSFREEAKPAVPCNILRPAKEPC